MSRSKLKVGSFKQKGIWVSIYLMAETNLLAARKKIVKNFYD